MSGETDSMPAVAVLGPLLMTLVIASIVGGVYVFVRGQVFTAKTGNTTAEDTPNGSNDGPEPNDATRHPTGETADAKRSGSGTRRQILDVLPDDERRILEPVIESPGLTQIKVRDRSDFSRSKVSQTITDLEERGLLYRESKGRTYRVYPADDLDERL